jgi:hypothetical protein
MCCPALTAWLYSGELGAFGMLMTSRMGANYLRTKSPSRINFLVVLRDG